MLVEILSFKVNWGWLGQIGMSGHATCMPHVCMLVTLAHLLRNLPSCQIWIRMRARAREASAISPISESCLATGSFNPEDPAALTVSVADKERLGNVWQAPAQVQTPKILDQSHVLLFKCLFSFGLVLSPCWGWMTKWGPKYNSVTAVHYEMGILWILVYSIGHAQHHAITE